MFALLLLNVGSINYKLNVNVVTFSNIRYSRLKKIL